MTQSGLTAFDIATLGLLVFSGGVGYLRGLLREVFSAGAFVAAGLATVFGYPFLKEPAHAALSPDWLGDVVVVVGIFMVIYIAVRILAGQVANSIRDGLQIGALDRSLGFGFGLLRGLLIMALGLIVFQAATPPDRMPGWLTGAKTYPMVNSTATALKSMAPADTANKLTPDETTTEPAVAPKSSAKRRAAIEMTGDDNAPDTRKTHEKPAKNATPDAQRTQAEQDAYDARDRRSLDQLITTTTE